MGIRIMGAGAYLPERIVTNEELTRLVDTSDEWIVSRTGIRRRHAATDEFNWEMGAKAARQALERAGVDPAEIGMVLVSTVTIDYLTPSTSCLIAHALGLSSPACFDLNCACAGFVAALDVAEKYVAAGGVKYALVVSTEMLTKLTDYADRATCVLFGDGAGAAVVARSDAKYASFLGSDPAGGKDLFARGIPPSNQFRDEPFSWEADGWDASNGHALLQHGQEVYKFATRALPNAVREACARYGVEPSKLDRIFAHQANYRILETAAKNLGLPMEKFYLNIEDHGNISSACIPVCLAEAAERGELRRGDTICIVGFGGGLVYAADVFEW